MTTTLVVDASVATKWIAKEEQWALARALLSGEAEFVAPDLLPIEVANTMWKKQLRGEIDAAAAIAAHDLIEAFPVVLERSGTLTRQALALSVLHRRTVYDSLYVALALREECQLVTADERLYNALRDAFPRTLVLLGDLTSDDRV